MTSSYPRITGPGFLARCSRRTAGFYRYWESKRRNGALPARADLDPLEMKQWLAGIVLVDVRRMPGESPPWRLIYRLVGTRANDLREQEATGKTVQEGHAGNN